MQKKWFYFSIGLVCFLFAYFFTFSNSSARTQSDNYVIWGDVFSAGGTETSSSGSGYGLQDTLGEAVILSATSTSATYGIKAGFRELNPDHFITLSVSSSAVALGTLDVDAATTASHTLTVDSNAVAGFTVTMSGSTLTSGANTIDAIGATATASVPGTEQFGINAVANTSPAVGAAPAGTAPIASAAGQYATANTFAFNSGDTIISTSQDINQTVFTISYLANIASSTNDGSYSTTVTYTATANF